MEKIEGCTKTVSILNTLGPIAQKIIELKQTRRGVVCDATQILRLIKQCESLHLACQNLQDHLVAEAKILEDDILLKEVKEFHQPLINCVECLAESTRDLHRGDVGVKNINEVWDNLIDYSERILSCLIKLLLSWDHAHLRKISDSLDIFMKAVNALKDLPLHLVPEFFQTVGETAKDALEFIYDRSANISRKSQRETLHIFALELRKTLSILANAVVLASRYPDCKGYKAYRDFVLTKLQKIVEDVKREAGLGSEEYNLQEPAKYINTLNHLFESVTLKPNEESLMKLPLINSMKASLEVVLRHCIGVALCVSTQDYSAIMTAAENVLHQIKVLSNVEHNLLPRTEDVDVLFDVIVDVLEILEVQVNSSLITLIVQTLTEPCLSLDALLSALKPSDSETSSAPDKTRICALVSAFEEDVDTLYQTAGLVIACIADASRVCEIECSLSVLGWLETGLVSLFLKATSKNTPESRVEIKMLSQHWVQEVTSLRKIIYNLMETDALVQASKQEIHVIWSDVREEICSCEKSWFRRKVRSALAHANSLLRLNEEDLYLTEKQCMELQRASGEVKRYEAKVLKGDFEAPLADGFVKRLQHLLTIVSRISSSLNRSTIAHTQTEEDIFGCKRYQEEYVAAKKQYYSECLLNDPLLLSNLSAVTVDGSVNRDVTPSQSCQSSPPQPAKAVGPEDSVQRNPPSIFKPQESVNIVRRTSRTKIMSPQELATPKTLYSSKSANHLDGNTSIDITKFLLSRSTNTFRNSTRASKRNFSLKVKEIDLDIGDVMKITPKAKVQFTTSLLRILNNSSMDEFTGVIGRMERFTSSCATTMSAKHERMYKEWDSYGGHDNTKDFKKKHLFYRTLNLLFAEQVLDMDEIDGEQNPPAKTEEEYVVWENVNDILKTSFRSGSKTGSEVTKYKNLQNTSLSYSKCIAEYSNSELLSSIASPSSLAIDTPERVGDLQKVQQRLSNLKSVSKVDM